MEQLSIIIGLVLAVLNIILFFKIWGMTNNVAAIKNKSEKPKSEQARIAYFRGDVELAKRLLDEGFFEDARESACDYNVDFAKEYKEIVSQYSTLYRKMDLSSPDFEKFNNKKLLVMSSVE